MTFYRTTYTVRVLTESPIPAHLQLIDVLHEADEGSYVADIIADKTERLDAERAAEALTEAGSEPEFFGLSDCGCER